MGIYGFEDRLSEARRMKKYTQEDLSNRLGVTPQAISKWERGQSLPDLDLLNSLCSILNCSSDYLIGISSQEEKITETGEYADKKQVLQLLYAEPLELLVGTGLIPIIETEQKHNNYKGLQLLRTKMAYQYGWLIPALHIKDDIELKEYEFRIISYDKVLKQKTAVSSDKIQIEDIYQSLQEILFHHYHTILNRQLVKTLVTNLSDRYPAIVNDVIPCKISYTCLQKVLCRIIEKKKSIHNFIKIIELLDEEYATGKDEILLADLIISKLYFDEAI